MRYAEEVELLEEEMRRVRQFLDWRAGWWRSLVGLRSAMQPDAALREGHAAYAGKQAGYMAGLSARFTKMWEDVPRFLEGAHATYATMCADDGDDEEEEQEEREAESGWLSGYRMRNA
ncbi:hypothetical protein B0H10DRAFT_607302 [Mycena sp. CBHHK59/15]|nr:hypothetical protein B0H10DRAFT_607302 [Mycena sp. CBHHK59/15]